MRLALLALAALILAGCETMDCGSDSGPHSGAGCSAHHKF